MVDVIAGDDGNPGSFERLSLVFRFSLAADDEGRSVVHFEVFLPELSRLDDFARFCGLKLVRFF